MHYVKHFHINGVDTNQVGCIELHGKPNAATEGAVGVLGIDVDSPLHDVYKCVAVNGSIYTWELLSSGLSIMSATISGEGEETVMFQYANLLTPPTYIIKPGDLIIDAEGCLYQIDSLNSTYCLAKYCGTQLGSKGETGDDGITPHIGENGNWWVGEEDTGALADLSGSEDRIKALENDIADLKYKEIVVGTFSASPSTAEMGSTVSSVALSWAVNKTPTELTLDGAAVDVAATSKTVTGTFTANKTWSLKATDERGATSSKTASLSFLNGVYYGVSTEPAAYDSAFILGLTKNLRSSKLTSFSVKAGSGQYIYYCLPKRMGTCSFKVGGFDGGFSLVDTILFTNASGHTEDYYVYRSDNAGLGQTAVTVS